MWSKASRRRPSPLPPPCRAELGKANAPPAQMPPIPVELETDAPPAYAMWAMSPMASNEGQGLAAMEATAPASAAAKPHVRAPTWG